MAETTTNILITGANGQIGTALTRKLRKMYGREHVVASDIRDPQTDGDHDPFIYLDVLNAEALKEAIKKYSISQVYHLAAILSAKGEQMPRKAWDININSLFNVLDAAKEHDLKVFFPSSIAVFSKKTPSKNTPQLTVLEPETVYGISKVAGESWCQYYHKKYGVDVRSVRYPGIIGHESEPGGGTTDYAVEIYHKAVKGESFECYLEEDARLPMMYMPDAIRATIEVMEASADQISVHTSYNLAAMSFSPAEVADAIREHIPDFDITYNPDYRQQIADTWPESIDDRVARSDWNWKPEFDLKRMTSDMLEHLWEHYRGVNITS